MIDRDKLESVLSRRFPGATRGQIASAANAIMGLEDEWEEVATDAELGFRVSARCPDICGLAHEVDEGTEFRVLRRRG